jgi:hypothetical protein
MHTLRLLEMAREIATEGNLRVRRPNRDYLLRIRAGEFDYDTLVALAEDQLAEVRQAFERSFLPAEPDRDAVNAVLAEIRHGFLAAPVPSSERMRHSTESRSQSGGVVGGSGRHLQCGLL